MTPAKVSAQSPPCSTNASPRATAASRSRELVALAGEDQRRKLRSSAVTAASWPGSGQQLLSRLALVDVLLARSRPARGRHRRACAAAAAGLPRRVRPSSPTGWPPWPAARRSCCRAATAPRPSLAPPPPRSGPSCRRCSRWPSCSPTARACPWSRSAGWPGSSPSRGRWPPSCGTASSCPPTAATRSTALTSLRRPGRLTLPGCCAPTTARRSTLNLCRAFTTGGYADLHQAHAWNQDFVADSPAGQRYERLAGEIDRALGFMRACGADPQELRTGRAVLQSRGAAARLRARAGQDRLADRPDLRHLGALPVGRRANPGAGRGPRGVRAVHRQPDRREARARHHPGRAAGPGRDAPTRTASQAG